MTAQICAQTNLLDAVAQCLLHKLQRGLCLLGLLLCRLLFFLACKTEILGCDVAQLLVGILHERLRNELIDLLGHEQHVIALFVELLKLRKLAKPRAALARCVVNVLLLLGHRVGVLLERDELALLVRPVQQQILKHVLLLAVIGDNAVLELHTEHREELFVFLAVVFQHLRQLGLDLLFKVACHELELAVVLEHFTGNIQAEVL